MSCRNTSGTQKQSESNEPRRCTKNSLVALQDHFSYYQAPSTKHHEKVCCWVDWREGVLVCFDTFVWKYCFTLKLLCICGACWTLRLDFSNILKQMLAFKNVCVEPVDKMYTWHQLNTCQHKSEQMIGEFLKSSQCWRNFSAVTGAQKSDAYILDAVIAGLWNSHTWQRLLGANAFTL